ncbi:hypothetical protein BCR43DRAFT_526493 [Syncephalastrum racemosum]|uniref:Uncharacterized protein n=1 Tax=Syncephalastrum racemosum TaxID=13706 RepID=A0A1X2H6J8_SYNRA|nr:hypothetical protein BCR43DRAFT_526493 [Syncephalastrum racemosum]
MEPKLLQRDTRPTKTQLFSEHSNNRQSLDWYKKQSAALKDQIRAFIRQERVSKDTTEALNTWMERAQPKAEYLLKHDDSPLPLPRQTPPQPQSCRLSVFQAPIAEEEEEEEDEHGYVGDSPVLPFMLDDDDKDEVQQEQEQDESPVDDMPGLEKEKEQEQGAPPASLTQLQHKEKQQMMSDIVTHAQEAPYKAKGRLYAWFLSAFLYRRPKSKGSSTKETKSLADEDAQSADHISTPIPTPIYQDECFQAVQHGREARPARAPREDELLPESKDFMAYCDSAYFGI